MEKTDKLRFAVSDRINDAEVQPEHVPLDLLGEFQNDVEEFLKGSNKDVDPSQVNVSIQSGSLTFVASGLMAASTLWADLDHIKNADSLSLMDEKRAAVIERWQSRARTNPYRSYYVMDKSETVVFRIDSKSDLKKSEDIWVYVEKYIEGKVLNAGGKKKANIHVELDTGETLTIGTPFDLLAQEEKNPLYKTALLHVAAEENLITKELRNYRLIAFEDMNQRFDDAEFNLMVERGTQAWKDVPDNWLESLRGNNN